jgi:hypothetical protein
MRYARLFGLAGGICVGLVVIGSAVTQTACEGDFEGCGTTGETAFAVSVVSAALAFFFLALAGLALAVRTLRRGR